MKNVFTLLLSLVTLSCLLANSNPIKPNTNDFNKNKQVITDELFKLEEISRIAREENLTHEQIVAKYPDLMEKTTVAPAVDDGIFSKAADSPLGIPGFWWGFCLGWIGMLIIYLSMDEGAERKEQVKNALYGCVAWAVIWTVLWFTVFAVADNTVKQASSVVQVLGA
jgi:hypothetical protein